MTVRMNTKYIEIAIQWQINKISPLLTGETLLRTWLIISVASENTHGFQGLLPPQVSGDLLVRPPPLGLPLLIKNRDLKYSKPTSPSLSYPHNTEIPKQFACEKCGRTYASTGNLKRHKKYKCGVEPQFSCPICKKKIQHRHTVKIHVFSTHRNEAGDSGPTDASRDSPALFPSTEGHPTQSPISLQEILYPPKDPY
ncbi:transcription factor che-1-like [Scylla paramamosain]|uniref:transcription factor che-1-like n=1 Tax=Scylla paramamosain TaxID=85552 RepID=UPI003083731A